MARVGTKSSETLALYLLPSFATTREITAASSTSITKPCHKTAAEARGAVARTGRNGGIPGTACRRTIGIRVENGHVRNCHCLYPLPYLHAITTQ